MEKKYRPNVAVIVTDGHGRVLLCERMPDTSETVDRVLQTVQGGIDPRETPREAAFRELYEEIGVPSDKVEIMAESTDKYSYDWSEEYKKTLHPDSFSGQEQQFFLAKVDSDFPFNLKTVPPQEFKSVRWGSAEELLAGLWAPKRPGTEAALREFGLL